METIGPVLKMSSELCFEDQFVKNDKFYPVGAFTNDVTRKGASF